MLTIESDNTEVEKYLIRIAEHIINEGGYIDPHAVIRFSDGIFSVQKNGPIESKYIFEIPHTLLIPYDDFDLDIENGDIVLATYEDNISKPQFALFEDMVALYNVSDIFKQHCLRDIWINHNDFPEIAASFLFKRHGHNINLIKDMLQHNDYADELALCSFFSKRAGKCRLHSPKSDFSEVILPVIEFFNHHPQGAIYTTQHDYADKASFLGIEESALTKAKDTSELYSCYGALDALDCYIYYGAINLHAQYARSIPLEIRLPELGPININANQGVVPVKDRAEHLKNLGFFLPKMQRGQDYVLNVSHTFFPGPNAPLALRRVLAEVVRTIRSDIDDNELQDRVILLEETLINHNLDYYKTLGQRLTQSDGNAEVKDALHKITTHQVDIIHKYKANIKKF